ADLRGRGQARLAYHVARFRLVRQSDHRDGASVVLPRGPCRTGAGDAGQYFVACDRRRGRTVSDTPAPVGRKWNRLDSVADVAPERGIGSDGRVQTAAFRDNMQIPYEGLRADAMSAGQRERLLRLAALYTDKLRSGHAEVWLDSVRQHLDDTHFVWM